MELGTSAKMLSIVSLPASYYLLAGAQIWGVSDASVPERRSLRASSFSDPNGVVLSAKTSISYRKFRRNQKWFTSGKMRAGG
jgi:hypothetical protein